MPLLIQKWHNTKIRVLDQETHVHYGTVIQSHYELSQDEIDFAIKSIKGNNLFLIGTTGKFRHIYVPHGKKVSEYDFNMDIEHRCPESNA